MLNSSVAHCWVYKYMLETEYGLRVSAMWLGQVHPCLPRARLIEVPCMRDELELIVEDQVARGEAIGAALPAAFFSLPACKIRSTDFARMCARPFPLSCLLILFVYRSAWRVCSLGSRWKARTQSSSFLACRMPPGGF